ncbi:MAG: hypothetical protein WCX64_06635 [Candidatus Micrarchaeia archaeon]|jgi:hypothetical protein
MTELSRKPRITPEVFHRLTEQEKLALVYNALSGLVNAEKEADYIFVPVDKENNEKLAALAKAHGVSSPYEAIERQVTEYITGKNRNLVGITIGPRGFRVSPMKK